MSEKRVKDYALEKQVLVQWAAATIPAPPRQSLPALRELDWPWLIGAAVAHKLAPLLCHRLADNREIWDLIPPEAKQLLIGRYDAALERHQLRSAQIAAILRALQAEGLPGVVLRGPGIAACYPASWLRSYSDLDILVAEEAVSEVKSLLYRLGYLPKKPESEWPEPDSYAYHWPEFYKPGAVLVEIHSPRHHFDGSLGLVDISEWLEDAQPAALCGVETRTLAPEENLLHICSHIHRHYFSLGGPYRLRHILDIYYGIKPGLDWARFLRIFQRHHSAQKQIYRHLEAAAGGIAGEASTDWFDWNDLAAHIHYGLSMVNEFFSPIVPPRPLALTRPEEERLLDLGLVSRSLRDERLYLWTIPRRNRFLDVFMLSPEQLIAYGFIKYWRQLPPFTSWDDGHIKAYAELCKTLPRIKP
jgi:hypothetical protein